MVAIEQVLGAFPTSVLRYDEAAVRRYVEMQESRRAAEIPLSVKTA